jgi:hypothetical protein
MSCVLRWSAISRVAQQHISAWRAVVAVLLLGLTVVVGCEVRPFCEATESGCSDEMDDDEVGNCGEDTTIALASTPEEVDVEVDEVVTVEVRVVTPAAGRTYSFRISEQPTSGMIPNESIETDPALGRMTFRFNATTSTGFTNDNIEISVTDSASEEGCLRITVRVGPDVVR